MQNDYFLDGMVHKQLQTHKLHIISSPLHCLLIWDWNPEILSSCLKQLLYLETVINETNEAEESIAHCHMLSLR